ncbi:3-galactosyl-N-acetylglucosaminide 4-alpha-L-fucosyltransferase FUT3-like [Physella acuta]|uniref:3-galactosyl-N-acetylglucosaminide 4-alpha-L-fucosyltransferase FUT3-like n=1 Tax=Physella acuta TaxID=109671 RepID=UPI0027DB45D9|nr:3-galactosyl-N-acetylglucosaminide 4-alpha-L-fucosyltransferase FUT3-like [Physella acuta]
MFFTWKKTRLEMRTLFKVLITIVIFVFVAEQMKRLNDVTQKPKLLSQTTRLERTILLKGEASRKSSAGEGKAEARVLTVATGSDDKHQDDGKDKEDDDEAEMRRLENSPYIYNENKERIKMSRPVVEKSVKYVTYLMPWGKEYHKHGFQDCMYSRCQYINNMSRAHAVMIKASWVKLYKIPTFHRPPGQRWVFFNFDPAVKNYYLEREEVKSLFNWTLTYQLHADVPFPFGLLEKYQPPYKDIDRIYDDKSKNIAWFVSHCDTWGLREVYVRRMSSVLPVDIFGLCGNLTCGLRHRDNDTSLCLPMLSKEYKFYLAFENSLCKDYVSEKFFKLFKDVDIIPVVRGGFDYKKYLPSGIFVDAADFSSPEELARYLLELGSDKKRYTEMLRRKNRWRYVPAGRVQCALCERMHTDQRSARIESIKDKFNGSPSDCHEPADL